jgi:hypothetical protein
MLPSITDIGGYIKALVNVLAAAAAVEVDGAAIQLVGPGYDYQSGVLVVGVGAATGTPTSFSVAADIEDSPDGTTSWAPVSGTSITPITANNGQASVKFNLRGTRGYIRAQVTPTFVGGSGPAIPLTATIVLGGATEHPAI